MLARIKRLFAPRPKPYRVEMFKDAGDKWRWRLRHRNGQVIASSNESYSSRMAASATAANLAAYAKFDLDVGDYEPVQSAFFGES